MRIIKYKAGWLVNGAIICLSLIDAAELLEECKPLAYDCSCPALPAKFDKDAWVGGFGKN